MKETTLCYLEQDEQYLMLYRDKDDQDINYGKWIGVGGKLKKGETPEAAMKREVKEETGYMISDYVYRGMVIFISNQAPDETMHLFTATTWHGRQIDCDEGTLKWVKKDEVFALPMWAGDAIFLDLLRNNYPFFTLTLYYEGDTLIRAELNGKTYKD